MVPSSMIALLISFELIAQAPGPTRDWVVIDSKEDGFSVVLPGSPVEQTMETPTPAGKIVSKFYLCQRGDKVLVMHCQRLPQPLSQDEGFEKLKADMEAGIKSRLPGQIEMVSRKAISKGTRKGSELVLNLTVPQGKKKVFIRYYMATDRVYALSAIATAGEPIPPEAEAFFNSIRFDGQPAVKPAMAGAAPASARSQAAAPTRPAAPPAKRKPLGKIERADSTPEAALRTFLMAMAAADEATLREVTLANPDIDWLLRGEPAPYKGIKELKQQILKMPIERLKDGDLVQMPDKKAHAIRPYEVGRDRAALQVEGAPTYTKLRRENGHWKVDAAPFIEARKAAEAAKQGRRG